MEAGSRCAQLCRCCVLAFMFMRSTHVEHIDALATWQLPMRCTRHHGPCLAWPAEIQQNHQNGRDSHVRLISLLGAAGRPDGKSGGFEGAMLSLGNNASMIR